MVAEAPDPLANARRAEVGARPSMRSSVVSGVKWAAVTQVFRQASGAAVAIVLARLLTPHEYGLAAMVLVFSGLALAFVDLGLGAGLVQRREITERDRSTMFWTSVSIGAALSLVGIVLAGPLAAFYGEPEVEPLFIVASLSFVFAALQTTQAAVLQRNMNFRALTLRGLVSVIAGGIVGVSAAAAGFGAWALIAQQLTITIAGAALLWTVSPWRPRFVFSRSSLLDLGGFGLNVFGTRLMGYASSNVDKLLVGRVLGAAPLGIYVVAYNLMYLPIARLIIPIQDTFYPAFARLQDDRERLGSVWLRAERAVAAILLPATLGLLVVASDFVTTILGERWREAGPVLQVLCVVAAVQSIGSLAPKLLTGLDRAKLLFRYSVITTIVVVAAFFVGLNWGILGVAVAYAAVSIPLQLGLAAVAARAVGMPLARVASNLGGVLQAAVLMVAATMGARLALVELSVLAPLRLSVVVLLGAAVYIAACRWRAPQLLVELRELRSKQA